MGTNGWRDVWFNSADGLRLYARDYGHPDAPPVICLSGLTRNSREFHGLAEMLSADYRVISPDYRGRGRSDHAADWQSYEIGTELQDVITLMDHLAIRRAAFIGTSRGGLIAMVMASVLKNRMTGVVLNDVGPVIEATGLARICGYVGKQAQPRDWIEAVSALRAAYPGFVLNEQEWLSFARIIFSEKSGRPAPDYDPALARTLPDAGSLAQDALPDLWPAFESLTDLPCAVIRGENSDLLSPATLVEMQDRMPGLTAVTVPERGHTPFLTEPDAIEAVMSTLRHCFEVSCS